MQEIVFSYIIDSPQDQETWSEITTDFASKTGIKVKLHSMSWDAAWGELFSYTTASTVPHVSHIGNTWVSSLARLNILQPFDASVLDAVGGENAFITPNWQAGLLPGSRTVWAIPWTGWFYAICYRKDMFSKIGVDPQVAFGNIKTTGDTITQLSRSHLDAPWINPRVPDSHRDLLHIAASWVWESGGDFINKQGTRILFTEPAAIQGFAELIKTYRAIPQAYYNNTETENFATFQEGKAAAGLFNVRIATVFSQDSFLHDKVGIASPTQYPWVGGGSLVAWKNAPGGPVYQRAAMELVKFLSSREVSVRYWQKTTNLPSRLDALEEIFPKTHSLHDALFFYALHGRSYNNIPLWRRIESQLSKELGQVLLYVTDNPSANIEDTLRTKLGPLARILQSMLTA